MQERDATTTEAAAAAKKDGALIRLYGVHKIYHLGEVQVSAAGGPAVAVGSTVGNENT